MTLRFQIARFLGHLPYFRGQNKAICLLHDPDRVFDGHVRKQTGIFSAHGTRFHCDTASFIEWGIAVKGGLERGLLSYFETISRRYSFDHFIDLGANVGFHAIPLSKHLPTLAFEPLPMTYRKLTDNIVLNPDRHMTAYPYALSDRSGTADLFLKTDHCNFGIARLDPFADGNDQERHQITLQRFDDVFDIRDKTLLIKIDTEGHELQALRGMARTLAENKCFLYIETTQADVEVYLQRIGYTVLYLKENIFAAPQRSPHLDGHLLAYNFDMDPGLA